MFADPAVLLGIQQIVLAAVINVALSLSGSNVHTSRKSRATGTFAAPDLGFGYAAQLPLAQWWTPCVLCLMSSWEKTETVTDRSVFLLTNFGLDQLSCNEYRPS